MELSNHFCTNLIHTYHLDVSDSAEIFPAFDSCHRMSLMKSKIKTNSIREVSPRLSPKTIASGKRVYLEFIGNQRKDYFWIRAKNFLETKFLLDLTVKTFDLPNAAF